MPVTAIGRPLNRYYRSLARIVRALYWGRVSVTPPQSPVSSRARLIVCSHRNGAMDGYVAMAAFPRAQFLVSVQLLRRWWMRLWFNGIPVVRPKDQARWGIQASTFGSPVEAGVAHLKAGGDLVVFPEGTSEWGPQPLPYQKGAARMARTLLEQGQPFDVVPVGLHYPQPDRFRAPVDVVVGDPLMLPNRAMGQSDKEWEAQLHATISQGLRTVSVDCPDQATFEKVEGLARSQVARYPDRESYGQAFLAFQNGWLDAPSPRAASPRAPLWKWALVSVAAVVFSPIVLAAWWAGQKADARNTVSFFEFWVAASRPCFGCLDWGSRRGIGRVCSWACCCWG